MCLQNISQPGSRESPVCTVLDEKLVLLTGGDEAVCMALASGHGESGPVGRGSLFMPAMRGGKTQIASEAQNRNRRTQRSGHALTRLRAVIKILAFGFDWYEPNAYGAEDQQLLGSGPAPEVVVATEAQKHYGYGNPGDQSWIESRPAGGDQQTHVQLHR